MGDTSISGDNHTLEKSGEGSSEFNVYACRIDDKELRQIVENVVMVETVDNNPKTVLVYKKIIQVERKNPYQTYVKNTIKPFCQPTQKNCYKLKNTI